MLWEEREFNILAVQMSNEKSSYAIWVIKD